MENEKYYIAVNAGDRYPLLKTPQDYSVLSAWDSNLTVMRLFFCLHPSRCSRAAERMNNENT